MEWIINQLRDHPELAIFLTLFAGFWLGRFKIGKFSLGTVTSVLLVGVLVGQLNISVDGPMKAVFFLLFFLAFFRLYITGFNHQFFTMDLGFRNPLLIFRGVQ